MEIKRSQYCDLHHEFDQKIDNILVALTRIETKIEHGFATKKELNMQSSKLHEKINKTVMRLFIVVVGLTSFISGLVSYITSR